MAGTPTYCTLLRLVVENVVSQLLAKRAEPDGEEKWQRECRSGWRENTTRTIRGLVDLARSYPLDVHQFVGRAFEMNAVYMGNDTRNLRAVLARIAACIDSDVPIPSHIEASNEDRWAEMDEVWVLAFETVFECKVTLYEGTSYDGDLSFPRMDFAKAPKIDRLEAVILEATVKRNAERLERVRKRTAEQAAN